MESSLVAEFIAQTGADSATALKCLRDKNWDIIMAIQTYIFGPSPAMSSTSGAVAEENGNVTESCITATRPSLHKSAAVDVTDIKKLTRGISRATDNVNLVSRARSTIESDVSNVNQYFVETPASTFTLPDLTVYPEDFRAFLEKDLIETSTLVSLEQAGRLNWWADSGACQRLWPLATTGDGNCLLHAASLGMWGFHDRLLTLRKALHAFLSSSDCAPALWRRWRWQQTRLNAEAGLVYSEEEWAREWDGIVNMASTEPRRLQGSRRRSMMIDKPGDEVHENATYESLEEIHVLALAHVLRRPIIIIADVMLKDVNGEDLAPIPFGGIYLPLECPSVDCHHMPLILTYDAAHFSSLVTMEKEHFGDGSAQPPAMIPLTDSEHQLLQIQFVIDPGEHFPLNSDINPQHFELTFQEKLALLNEYLEVVHVSIPTTPCSDEVCDPSDEDDIEKRFSELADVGEPNSDTTAVDVGIFGNNCSKAAKQFQSVAKQFGSIGKSVSKKLKKNLGSITKMTRSNSQKKVSPVRQTTKTSASVSRSQDYILCAALRSDIRPDHQDEMMRNYLQSAHVRFQNDKDMKLCQAEERRWKEEQKLKDVPAVEGASECINPGCTLIASAATSYMCRSCYEKQRDQELSTNINSPLLTRSVSLVDDLGTPRYGTGKSKFYAESDVRSHNVISRLPTTRAGSNNDHTLYLSKSTFYDDSGCPPSLSPQFPGFPNQSIGLIKNGGETNSSTKRPLTGRYSFGQEQSVNPSSRPRLHSYNMSKLWENTAGDSASKYAVNGGQDHMLAPLQEQPASSAVAGTRSVSVAMLSAQPSGDLPAVEQVSRPSSEGVAWGVCLPIVGAQPCRSSDCRFFGSPESSFYCSKCYKERLQPAASVTSVAVREVKR
ncbi:OTU domain-containing protein 7B-like isoform X2 [Bacillus rossius redtenbacheri]